jgi:hypothetical protein
MAKTLFDRPARETGPVAAKKAGNPTFRPIGDAAPRVAVRSVFDVGPGVSLLAIGHFNRPLLTEEVASLRVAYERAKLPEVVDFEVTPKQISFLSPVAKVAATWSSIDRLLANPSLAKAS